MSDSLREHLDQLVELIEDVIRENVELKKWQPVPKPLNNRPKLTKNEVKLIHTLKRSGCSNSELAEAFDVNKSTISRTLSGQYNK